MSDETPDALEVGVGGPPVPPKRSTKEMLTLRTAYGQYIGQARGQINAAEHEITYLNALLDERGVARDASPDDYPDEADVVAKDRATRRREQRASKRAVASQRTRDVRPPREAISPLPLDNVDVQPAVPAEPKKRGRPKKAPALSIAK